MAGATGSASMRLRAVAGRLPPGELARAGELVEQDARVALLRGLLDHAPMFPPASLPVRAALSADGAAATSPESWMLGRLVVPASALLDVLPSPRPLSVVLDVPLPAGAQVAAVEVPAGRTVEAGTAPEIYCELELTGEVERQLEEIASSGVRAKLRCGGRSIPTVSELAAFVRAARGHGVPFKATAGLHRAIRSGANHGFLNLLAAVAFPGEEEQALTETEAGAFRLDGDHFAWRDRRAAADELEALRRLLFVAIGTCSFAEPVSELRALGMLP